MTMKIKVVSDLHLEMLSEFSISELGHAVGRTPADVLILAGDICPLKSKRWKLFLEYSHVSFDLILWVPGNHEYYGCDYKNARTYHRQRITKWNEEKNTPLVLLNNQNYVFDDVNFIGSTLWADFRKRDPAVMAHVSQYMNDFHVTKNGGRTMTTQDHLGFHDLAKRYIFAECKRGTKRGQKNFVITHHGPSWLSVADKFKQDPFSILFNGAFVSALDKDIQKHDIDFWVHGHTHVSFDYSIGKTRVVVNPHGYQNENAWGFDPNLILEINNG